MKTLTTLLYVILLLTLTDARAEFYKYKDSSGAIVITDKLENVPAKYRKQFKVVWDEDLEKRDSLAKRRAAAKAQFEKEEQKRVQSQQQQAAAKKKSTGGKRLVITMDEDTGEVVKRFE